MIIRRTLIIIASILAILVAGGATILTGGQLARTINWVLPEGWQVEIPFPLESGWEKANLPHFALSYQGCPLLKTDNFRVQWVKPLGISLQKATLDYGCLATLPNSQSPSPTNPDSLKNILELLPEGSVKIEQLAWQNLPAELPERLTGLLALPSRIEIAKKRDDLTACLKQHQLNVCSTLTGLTLSGKADYQPSELEHHHLAFNATLSPTLFALPTTFTADYQWTLPEKTVANPALQRGKSQLQWQQSDKNGTDEKDTGEQYTGQWQVQSLAVPTNQLTFPFHFDKQSLAIEQGRVDWAINKQWALRGFLTSKITPNSLDPANLFPIKTAIRLSLLSENEKGKGNVVINSPEGEWLADSFNLPVNIHGNVKQGDFILYSAVPLSVNGTYNNPTLRFLPKALLRLTGKARFLTIDDLRFPLAGIRVDKQGIHGRLQAILRGESPDFKQIELHLDGYANQFKAGLHRFFSLKKGEPKSADRWQWRFWGTSQLHSVKSPLSVAGRGHWQGNIAQLSEFQGKLGKIQQGGVHIPKLSLNLLEPIIFAYEKWHLTGGVQLSAPKAQFRYGGELDTPTARLNVSGEVDNLNLKGEIVSGKLGPIRLFARRELTAKSSNFVGRLYWGEQPLKVFQPLLPFRSNWVITQGSVRGETAFSATSQKGFVAGGHFAIRNGGFSFPSGELKGVEFSLPYRWQNNEVDIGVKKALDVRIAQINVGVSITNAKLKVQGHYPYSKKRPLFLRELSFELLGGVLNVEHFALPQTQVAQLNLRHIQLEQILQLAQYHQLDLKGSIHATFPFWLKGKPCYICGGTFTQAGSSQLKFTPELLKAMEKSGYTEQLLTYLVNDSQIRQLSGNIDLASNGEMQLHSSLKMFLTEHQNAKINLNYNHQENMFDLWKLINYGSQFEQNIEHSIYQQLDNR